MCSLCGSADSNTGLCKICLKELEEYWMDWEEWKENNNTDWIRE